MNHPLLVLIIIITFAQFLFLFPLIDLFICIKTCYLLRPATYTCILNVQIHKIHDTKIYRYATYEIAYYKT